MVFMRTISKGLDYACRKNIVIKRGVWYYINEAGKRLRVFSSMRLSCYDFLKNGVFCVHLPIFHSAELLRVVLFLLHPHSQKERESACLWWAGVYVGLIDFIFTKDRSARLRNLKGDKSDGIGKATRSARREQKISLYMFVLLVKKGNTFGSGGGSGKYK